MRKSLNTAGGGLAVLAFLLGAYAFAQTPNTASGAASRDDVHALKITILSTMLAQEGLGEWGFSALVETDGKKILFDTGAHPDTVLKNAKDLKIDLSDIQDVVLSHFHDDHTSGLMTLRREFEKKNPQAFSRVHVAKGIFFERRGKDVNEMIPMKKEYEATGGVFIEHDKPEEILPGVWLTGPIPRLYPEKNYAKGIEVEENGSWVEDNVPEDQSLVFNTTRGLVLLAGCGHAGVVNTLEYARKFIAPEPVEAAIGGFHMFNAKDEQVDWMADKLKDFHTANVLGAHCTGIESVYRIRQRLGLTRQTCVVGTVGATYTLDTGIHTGAIAQ